MFAEVCLHVRIFRLSKVFLQHNRDSWCRVLCSIWLQPGFVFVTQFSHSYVVVRVSALISLQVFKGSSHWSCVKPMYSVSLSISSVHLSNKPNIQCGSACAMIHVHSLDLKNSAMIWNILRNIKHTKVEGSTIVVRTWRQKRGLARNRTGVAGRYWGDQNPEW